jgi:hypothetical protein
MEHPPRQQRAALRRADPGFMKRIGLADHVIVGLSDKYLRSPYSADRMESPR